MDISSSGLRTLRKQQLVSSRPSRHILQLQSTLCPRSHSIVGIPDSSLRKYDPSALLLPGEVAEPPAALLM